MILTKTEIIDLARRYVGEDEIGDFPQHGDLFCFIERENSEKVIPKDEHDGWMFSGYALCTGYEDDPTSKPQGKWLLFNFFSLQTFPPTAQSMKLQPPHIVKGTFTNQDRTREIRVLRIADTMFADDLLHEPLLPTPDTISQTDELAHPDNIIQFPGNKK